MFLSFAEWLQGTPVSLTIQTVTWIIPLLQSIHIVMIGIVFVSIFVIALRIFGFTRTDDSLSVVVRRFSPWIWIGLVVMATTGALLVVGEPVRQFTALSFWLKMGLLVVGIASAVVFRRALSGMDDQDAVPSAGIKSVTIATVLLWILVIFLGRAIAYDVEVWGSLSLTGNV